MCVGIYIVPRIYVFSKLNFLNPQKLLNTANNESNIEKKILVKKHIFIANSTIDGL